MAATVSWYTPTCREIACFQKYLAHKKHQHLLGSPSVPRHRATVGSYVVAFSYERGHPVDGCDRVVIHANLPRRRWISNPSKKMLV